MCQYEIYLRRQKNTHMTRDNDVTEHAVRETIHVCMWLFVCVSVHVKVLNIIYGRELLLWCVAHAPCTKLVICVWITR